MRNSLFHPISQVTFLEILKTYQQLKFGKKKHFKVVLLFKSLTLKTQLSSPFDSNILLRLDWFTLLQTEYHPLQTNEKSIDQTARTDMSHLKQSKVL